MAAESDAYALAAIAQAPEPFRRMLDAIFGGRTGIVKGTDFAVTQNGTPNMSVNVALGQCVIKGTETAAQGSYFCQANTTTNIPITTADATNPRRDLVLGRIRDAQYATGPSSAFDLYVLAGTPSSSPVDPTPPANTIVLARVAVAAAAGSIVTANLTDLRTTTTGQVQATALGGVTVCTSTARPTANLYEGLLAYQTDTNTVIYYDGTVWVPQGPQAFQAVIGTYLPTGTFASVGASFSIPAGRWMFYGKSEAADLTGTVCTTDLRIQNTTDGTTLDQSEVFFGSGVADRVNIVVMYAATFTSTKVIQLQGINSAGGGSNFPIQNIKFMAHAVVY